MLILIVIAVTAGPIAVLFAFTVTKAITRSVNKLVDAANKLAGAALAGALSTRADATQHQGDYRKIVEGVNNTLDAVIVQRYCPETI